MNLHSEFFTIVSTMWDEFLEDMENSTLPMCYYCFEHCRETLMFDGACYACKSELLEMEWH